VTTAQILSRLRSRAARFALVAALVLTCAARTDAQDTDEFGDAAADPVKLFNRGQEAHAKKEFEQALEFYEEALKLRPEFPEAEFQKAAALVALKRIPEAEESYRRAIGLRPTWSLPHAALGLMLARVEGREREAEPLFRRALELDPKNLTATVALAELRTSAGNTTEGVSLWRRATEIKTEDASLWLARGRAERAAKDAPAALKSFARALTIDPVNIEARLARVDVLIATGEKTLALEDIRALEEPAKVDWELAVALANRYGLADRREDARRIYDALPEEAKNSDDGKKLHAALTDVSCEDTDEARAALEKSVASDPKNSSALACLGKLYRTTDPPRSLDFFRRAAELEPGNVDYAVGYAAALVQLRKFSEAATILDRILKIAPDSYEAHANFAAALYELKLYKQVIVEYKWIAQARPALAVVHFFIATAHDRLGEYSDALSAYETFLARADAQSNQLEIEKVNLRLPSLRNQIKRGEGVKQDKKAQQ
jgi:tetratricopeptide (TPR) repeat protein